MVWGLKEMGKTTFIILIAASLHAETSYTTYLVFLSTNVGPSAYHKRNKNHVHMYMYMLMSHTTLIQLASC